MPKSKMERRKFITGVLAAGPALGLTGSLTPTAEAAAPAAHDSPSETSRAPL